VTKKVNKTKQKELSIHIFLFFFSIINIYKYPMFFNFQALIKYLLEGMAVALAAFFIPQRKVEVKEIVLIALTAAAVFSILDQFSPSIGASARQGAGFGIGLNQVGWGGPGTYDDYYGGQPENTELGPDKVSCTCEVDADTLRKRVCPVHVAPAEAPMDEESEDEPTMEGVVDESTADASEEAGFAEQSQPEPEAEPPAAPATAQLGGLGAAGLEGRNGQIEAFDGFSRHF
jgi:hypothetical protein